MAAAEQFNYLAVLISMILGLGITQLLTGLARLVHARDRLRPYGPTFGWVMFLLLAHVQTWWSMFGLRLHHDWTFAQFFIVLLQPITLFMLAALVLPETRDSGTVDLRANYFAQARWFYSLTLVLIVVSVVKDLMLSGALPDRANLAAHALWFALGVGAMVTRRERFHQWLVPVNVLAFVAYIIVLFARLR